MCEEGLYTSTGWERRGEEGFRNQSTAPRKTDGEERVGQLCSIPVLVYDRIDGTVTAFADGKRQRDTAYTALQHQVQFSMVMRRDQQRLDGSVTEDNDASSGE